MTTIKHTATTLGLKAGDTVQLVRGEYKGATAKLVRCDGSIWPWFTLTQDHGPRREGRELAIYLKEDGENSFIKIPEGDKGGFIANEGCKPVLPASQRVDLLYKDGSLMVDVTIGSHSNHAKNTGKYYSSNNWNLFGTDSSIIAYRLKEVAVAVATTPKIEKEIEMKVGSRVVLLHTVGCAWSSTNNRVEGTVTKLSSLGATEIANVTFDNGSKDWGRRAALQLVQDSPSIPAATVDTVLAQLKGQIEVAAKDIEQANDALVGATVRHAALVETLTKHGFSVSGSAAVEVNAKAAFDQKLIKRGTILRCNTVCEEMVGEHIAGKTYKVTSIDDGSLADQELESEDGYGIWVDNEFLEHYTVVSFT